MPPAEFLHTVATKGQLFDGGPLPASGEAAPACQPAEWSPHKLDANQYAAVLILATPEELGVPFEETWPDISEVRAGTMFVTTRGDDWTQAHNRHEQVRNPMEDGAPRGWLRSAAKEIAVPSYPKYKLIQETLANRPPKKGDPRPLLLLKRLEFWLVDKDYDVTLNTTERAAVPAKVFVHYIQVQDNEVAPMLCSDSDGAEPSRPLAARGGESMVLQAWTLEEDQIILGMVRALGPKWNRIVQLEHQRLPGRTPTSVRNRWQQQIEDLRERDARQADELKACLQHVPASPHTPRSLSLALGGEGDDDEAGELLLFEGDPRYPHVRLKLKGYTPPMAAGGLKRKHTASGVPVDCSSAAHQSLGLVSRRMRPQLIIDGVDQMVEDMRVYDERR